jgi:hypothetical protein
VIACGLKILPTCELTFGRWRRAKEEPDEDLHDKHCHDRSRKRMAAVHALPSGLPRLIAPALGREVVACRSPLRLPVHDVGCNSLRSGGPLWAAVLKCDTLGCPR